MRPTAADQEALKFGACATLTLYLGETSLRDLTLEMMRMHVPSATDIRLVRLPGPFRPRNWTVEWINVLAEDYGAARDLADDLASRHDWIMVPDRHPLDGQVYGEEVARRRVGPED